MKNIIALTILSACLYVSGNAQNTFHPNIYYPNNLYYNAGAGLTDTLFDRLASVYVKGKSVPDENDVVWEKPASVYLSQAGRIKERSFYHGAFIHERYSYYNRNTIYAGYGHALSLGKSHQLSLGLRPLLNIDAVDWDELGEAPDEDNQSTYLTFDMDLGAQYHWGGLVVGAAVKNLLESSVKVGDETLIQNWREWYVNASFTFGRPDATFRFSPFIQYLQERDIEMDLGLNVSMFKHLDIAYALRTFELRNIFSARYQFLDHFRIGAAADFSSVFSDANFDVVLEYAF